MIGLVWILAVVVCAATATAATIVVATVLKVPTRDCSDHRLGRLGDFRILSDFRFGVDLKVDLNNVA